MEEEEEEELSDEESEWLEKDEAEGVAGREVSWETEGTGGKEGLLTG